MKLTEKEVLEELIKLLLDNLEEIKSYGNREGEQFQYGEKTAYVECLEYIQMLWEHAGEYGLDFDVEEVYPI